MRILARGNIPILVILMQMDAKALKADLRTLGWSQSELAERIDTHPNTVSRWISDNKVPGPVAAYVRLALQVHTLSKALNP